MCKEVIYVFELAASEDKSKTIDYTIFMIPNPNYIIITNMIRKSV